MSPGQETPPAATPTVRATTTEPPPRRGPSATPTTHTTTQRLRHAPMIPRILPHERVFPIQIGSELFKLSGASLSSDAPSYFSQYFQCQLQKAAETPSDDDGHGRGHGGPEQAIRTLYIDRDPVTFHDISLHLQGYHVAPRDGTHFVRLFADAQFYSLPRLITQLYEESIFMSIGHREFQIPRHLFQDPGNSPNYFSLGFAIFFSSPDDLFPGLDREGLLRPPSILPPAVPGRSADVFAELLHLLRGYPVEIRSAEHRQALLRDCRYFNFKGLEQRLIPHQLSFNQARDRTEMVLRLEDILKSGLSVAPDPVVPAPAGWVAYARPFVDDRAAELVLEIGGENTRLQFGAGSNNIRAAFVRDAKARIARLLEVVATKLNLPPTTQPLGLLMASGGAASQPPSPGNTPLSEDLVRVELGPETAIQLDGRPFVWPPGAEDTPDKESDTDDAAPVRKRRRVDGADDSTGPIASDWIVRDGQWRLRIQAATHGKSTVECVLVGVRIDAYRSELARNRQRGFLGGV